MSYLRTFSDRFELAVSLWPLAAAVLTLPILAFLYHRNGRLRIWTVLGAYLSVLYALALVCFTLYPLPDGPTGLGFTYGREPQLKLTHFVSDLRTGGRTALYQILFNVVFFVPFGFICKRGFGWSWFVSTAMAFLASLLIETAQLTGVFGVYEYAYRTFDVDDLVWNTSGAVIGWICACIAGLILPSTELAPTAPTRKPGLVRRFVALFLDFVIVVLAWYVAGFAMRAYAVYRLGYDAQSLPTRYEDIVNWTFVAVAVLVEVVVPLAAHGSTPGGAFVRMSCEPCHASLGRRLAFYAVRFAVLWFIVLVWPVLVVFYLVKRQMPYDYILLGERRDVTAAPY